MNIFIVVICSVKQYQMRVEVERWKYIIHNKNWKETIFYDENVWKFIILGFPKKNFNVSTEAFFIFPYTNNFCYYYCCCCCSLCVTEKFPCCFSSEREWEEIFGIFKTMKKKFLLKDKQQSLLTLNLFYYSSNVSCSSSKTTTWNLKISIWFHQILAFLSFPSNSISILILYQRMGKFFTIQINVKKSHFLPFLCNILRRWFCIHSTCKERKTYT